LQCFTVLPFCNFTFLQFFRFADLQFYRSPTYPEAHPPGELPVTEAGFVIITNNVTETVLPFYRSTVLPFYRFFIFLPIFRFAVLPFCRFTVHPPRSSPTRTRGTPSD
jgi:hypothetical protein